MNIQQAIQSGKPFRRSGWPDDDTFLIVEHPDTDYVACYEQDVFTFAEFSIQDILADDWYLREDEP